MKENNMSPKRGARTAAGSVAVVVFVTFAYLVIVNRDLPIDRARQFARVEMGSVAERLHIQEGFLVGPTIERKSGKEFYFTWVTRERPDRPAMIVWVSSTGDTDATIVDATIINTAKKGKNGVREH